MPRDPRTVIAIEPQRDFEPFGTSHLVVLVLLVVGSVALVALGRRQTEQQGRRFDRALGVVFAAAFVLALLHKLFRRATVAELPLQLSDVAEMTAAYALWSGAQWAFSLTYFWGFVLGAQALITPDLSAPDFPDPEFLGFFFLHLMLVWAAIRLTWGRRRRPTWRSYRFALLATVVWAAAAMSVNAATDTNFGFLNRKPAAGSILDYMGPWPFYLLAEAAVLVVLWAVMTWPWQRARSAAQQADRG